MKINLSQDSCVTSSDEACDLKEPPKNLVMGRNLGNEAVVSQSSAVENTAIAPPLPPPVETKPQPPACKKECKVPIAFPWIVEFKRRCQADIGNFNIHVLEKLMTIYLRVVASSVNACYQKPNRAAKLKISMNDTLMLFHLFYSDIKKPLEPSKYLDKMSDLMAMYIDMEITASRRRKETMSKIASKLTSSLYIYLDHSQDHILDAIFKTKCMHKNNSELCNMIFSRILRDSPGSAVYEMTYIRYVLAFKMWKRLFEGAEERRNVMKLAVTRLIPPSQFKEKLRAGLLHGVLPKIPKTRSDVTMFLMQAKFCIKDKTKAFLKAISDPKQQGVISTLVPDFDPSFFSDIPDGSPPSSSLSLGDDTEEPTQGSFMNDIWSVSHGNDRICNILKKKAIKGKVNKKTKCKGIATPVFKKDTTTETKPERELKKKKIEDKPKKPADAINAVKPLPAVSQSGDDATSEDDSVTKDSSPEMPQVSQSRMPEPPKSESSESDCVEVKREIEQVNLVDSPTGGIGESPGVVAPIKDEPHAKRLKTEDTEESKPLGPQLPAEPLDSRAYNQQLIKQIAENLEKQGRYPKSQGKAAKTPTPDTVGSSPNPPDLPTPGSTRMLHNKTLRHDFNTFINQQKFRSHCLTHNEPPASPVPSPFDGEEGTEPRCSCPQCCANQNALVTNHRILTQYREDHINGTAASVVEAGATDVVDTVVDTGIVSDIGDTGLCADPGLCVDALCPSAAVISPAAPEQPSCLPLKKRKTAAAVDEVEEVSYPSLCYPSTPMISIAVLEDTRVALAAQGVPLPGYGVSPVPTAPAVSPAVFPLPSPPLPPPLPPTSPPVEPVAPTVRPPAPVVHPQAPVHTHAPKFKTPAQLKEGPQKSSRSESDHRRPAKEIAAAHSLINFGKDSHFSKSSRTDREKSPRYATRSSEKSHSRRKKS